ncbi:putative invertase inhibitor [Papaver somniferum]|uniref:putative invertase inhibitor n=1 Tax=Papaver somniferum TaxID=3469 RepID=UPI000E7028B2|nr:putative invertase inhibitor [Papaver somniferum]
MLHTITVVLNNRFSPYGLVNGDLIGDICKKASTSDPQLKYDFYVASLSENPASKDADILRLGEISLQTCQQNATSMDCLLVKLVFTEGKGKQDPKPYYPLKSCLGMYGGAIGFTNSAVYHFKIKDYNTTDTMLSAALVAPTECENRYKDSGLACPFTKENGVFFQLIRISLAIIHMVK